MQPLFKTKINDELYEIYMYKFNDFNFISIYAPNHIYDDKLELWKKAIDDQTIDPKLPTDIKRKIKFICDNSLFI